MTMGFNRRGGRSRVKRVGRWTRYCRTRDHLGGLGILSLLFMKTAILDVRNSPDLFEDDTSDAPEDEILRGTVVESRASIILSFIGSCRSLLLKNISPRGVSACIPSTAELNVQNGDCF